MVLGYMWCVLESKSFIQSSNIPITHFTYMYAPIGIVHIMLELILDREPFDTLT